MLLCRPNWIIPGTWAVSCLPSLCCIGQFWRDTAVCSQPLFFDEKREERSGGDAHKLANRTGQLRSCRVVATRHLFLLGSGRTAAAVLGGRGSVHSTGGGRGGDSPAVFFMGFALITIRSSECFFMSFSRNLIGVDSKVPSTGMVIPSRRRHRR